MTTLPGCPAWVEEAVELYRSGLSAAAVADRLGIKTSTVRYHLRTVPDLARRSSNPWAEPPWAAEAERLYRAGSSKRRTAEQLIAAGHSDVSEGRVLRALVSRGVQIRHPREAAQRNLHAGAHLVGRRMPISALSQRTLADYGRRWRRFERWCQEANQPSLPTTVDTLKAFIAYMAQRGHCSTYLSSHLNAIRFQHDLAEEVMPPVTLPELMPRTADGTPAAAPLRGYRPRPVAGRNASARTLADYGRRWAVFQRWCSQHGQPGELPVPLPALLAYRQHLTQGGYSASYIGGQMIALRAHHVRAGHPFPARLDATDGATDGGADAGTAPLAGLEVRDAA